MLSPAEQQTVCLFCWEKHIMLNIEKKTSASEQTFVLSGRLDTATAPELDAMIKQSLADVTEMTFE